MRGDGGEGMDRRDPDFSCLPEQRARRLGDWPEQLPSSLSQVGVSAKLGSKPAAARPDCDWRTARTERWREGRNPAV